MCSSYDAVYDWFVGVQMMVTHLNLDWKQPALRIIHNKTGTFQNDCMQRRMQEKSLWPCGFVSIFFSSSTSSSSSSGAVFSFVFRRLWSHVLCVLLRLSDECDNRDNALSLLELICDFFASELPQRRAIAQCYTASKTIFGLQQMRRKSCTRIIATAILFYLFLVLRQFSSCSWNFVHGTGANVNSTTADFHVLTFFEWYSYVSGVSSSSDVVSTFHFVLCANGMFRRR